VVTGGTGTRAFLFADLRGYTRYVDAHGDAAAAELLADYRTLTRGVIGRHDGAEIRTEGDGIYVVFESVAAAVDAGLELVDAAGAARAANPSRPIRVAVGIHAGETTATDEGPVGSAVNIAARICAKADAGEVLVSGTVRDLVRTARPYRATSLGSQHLKGVADPIPIFRLESAPSGLGPRLVRKARARRRTLSLLAVGVAIVIVAAGAAWAVNRPPDCLTLPAGTKDVVARIDTTRGCVLEVVPVGARPGPIVATDDAIWVADRDSWTITRIDRASGRILGYTGLPGSPISLAADQGGDVEALAYDDKTPTDSSQRQRHRLVFLGRGTGVIALIQLLPIEQNVVEGTNPISRTSYTRLADEGGRTWIVSPRGTVLRATVKGRSAATWGAVEPSRPSLVVAAAGSVWVGDEQAPSLYRFEGLGAPTALTLAGDAGVQGMAATDTTLWLLQQDGDLTSVDVESLTQHTIPLEGAATDLVVGGDAVWLLDGVTRSLRRVDPTTGRTLADVAVGGVPSGAAFVGGDLWATISAP
jgi:class 3 adenylate cyclase